MGLRNRSTCLTVEKRSRQINKLKESARDFWITATELLLPSYHPFPLTLFYVTKNYKISDKFVGDKYVPSYTICGGTLMGK